MRFYNYINEDEKGLEKWKSLIKDNCQPFLKEIRKYKGRDNIFLFSGRKTSKNWFEGSVMQNRKPLDTPLEIHQLLDKLFHKKFGIKARSQTLFCTNDYVGTHQYGNPYYIFPIGKYKTIWSPKISDLYIHLKKLFGINVVDNWNELSVWKKRSILKLLKKSDMLNYYTDKSHVFAKNSEIMLHCKEYIAIHYYLKSIDDIWGVIDEIL